MTTKRRLLEEKHCLLKRMLDKNLQRRRSVEITIKKQREELKEMEVLLEKVQITPIYISRH